MFSAIRYCWPISKVFPMPRFSLKRKKTTDQSNCMTGLSRYNQLMNLFPFNRRSSLRNLLISLKVNKQKKKEKKKKLRLGVFVLIFDVTSVFHFLKIQHSFPIPDPPPPPIYLDSFSFCYFLFLFLSSFSSPEANDYDQEDEAGNPLTVDEGSGKLISDGASAINLPLDRFIRSRRSVAYPCLCFLQLNVPRHGLFELYSGSYHFDFLNDFKARLTQ